MFKSLILASALLASSAALAKPLTMRPGESWMFRIAKGQPAQARRVAANARPAPGEVKATMLSALGTSMTLSNNSPIAYTFRAELLGVPAGAGKPAARTCTLAAHGKPVLEYWPTKAAMVRIGEFKPTVEGRC